MHALQVAIVLATFRRYLKAALIRPVQGLEQGILFSGLQTQVLRFELRVTRSRVS
ncbi:hypothetical protein BDZ89DRAFT_1059447 [Hymenopellis radicata]|nr:hypothetical protein BDZ89DRAFT_1059447 [Hymenopellis radicata]